MQRCHAPMRWDRLVGTLVLGLAAIALGRGVRADERDAQPAEPFGPAVCGIYVATSGVNAPGGGLTASDPVQTITFALQRAIEAKATCVFVRAGTYNEHVALVASISIVGGFDANWESAPYTTPGHATIIAAPLGAAPHASVTASNLTGAAASLSNLIIVGPNVTGTGGQSSYGVYANSNLSPIVLSNLRIEAGNGANGAPGVAGTNAALLNSTAAMNGLTGDNGEETDNCDDTSVGQGGLPGINGSCNSNTTGGIGGDGGTADTQCGFPPVPNATAGDPGGPGSQAASGIGTGGFPGNACFGGQPGLAGRITNGTAGDGAATLGAVTGNQWLASAGTAGAAGQNGGGGGGGGGAGGCDSGTDAWGGGGGGGGAGGCRGVSGGGGGTGGGGSFGVFAITSSVTLNAVEIIRGNGGNGGAGGTGGQGQMGGSGGPGGTTPDGGTAGMGGAGGHGGHGGGGGGGAGGISYGVFCQGSSIANLGVTVSGGMAGAGGLGGISAPFAPMAIDDGNDGSPGVDGQLGGLVNCSGGPPTAVATCDPSACPGTPCVADIAPKGGNGVVNVDDLLQVINAWGDCP